MEVLRRLISRQKTGRLEAYDPYVCEIAHRRDSLQVVHMSMLLAVPPLNLLFVRSVFLLPSMTLT